MYNIPLGDFIGSTLFDGVPVYISQAGKVECVLVLLDRGAQVNLQDKVWVVIIHCIHAMQHVFRVPVVQCARTLFKCMHAMLFISATRRVIHTSLTTDAQIEVQTALIVAKILYMYHSSAYWLHVCRKSLHF